MKPEKGPGSCCRRVRRIPYPDRTNFWKHRGVSGASRAAAPDATVTSPT